MTNNQNVEISLKQDEEYDYNQEYEVEKILDMRIIQRVNKITKQFEVVKEFLIKWAGYEELTWEPYENLINCQIALENFYKRKNSKKLCKDKKRGKTVKKSNQRKRNNSTIANKPKNKYFKKSKSEYKPIKPVQKDILKVSKSIIKQNSKISNKTKKKNSKIGKNKKKNK